MPRVSTLTPRNLRPCRTPSSAMPDNEGALGRLRGAMTESEPKEIAKQLLAVKLNSRTAPDARRNSWKNNYWADGRIDGPISSLMISASQYVILRPSASERIRIASTSNATPGFG